MNGAVAAGHPLTAEAGARILAEGGNAVDACIAATCVSWVTESPLTGPGSGGFMLVHRARDRTDRVLDFFVAAPGAGLPAEAGADMVAVDVAFDVGNLQRFWVGAGSCAVPGAVAGLAEAHRMYGTVPWAKLLAPAIECANTGFELTPTQAVLHTILDPALRRSAEGKKIYGADAPLAAGDPVRMRDLGRTLELLAEEGGGAFYRGELARRISEHVLSEGGLVTERDLASYRVIRRSPVRAAYRGHVFVSNPPPSSGGILIAFALAILERLGPLGARESPETIARLAAVMREAGRVRGGRFMSALFRGGLAATLLSADHVEEAVARARDATPPSVREPQTLPSTTHVSVVDAAGNAASLSASTGCGSGVIVPGTGIHVNNMLGEADLNPLGRRTTPRRRLTSMMAPSLVLLDGRPRLVVGSAGSERLRGAIIQIVTNVVDYGMSVRAALAAPRVHVDAGRLHLEGGIPARVASGLEARGYDVVRWRELNVYFGGASAVEVGRDGELAAAGDPRRGGAGIVVS
jgi:gamma-glutamyltranspeptidase/glutathione hydrolase